MSSEPTHLRWRKSTFSGGNGGQCVEVAESPDGSRFVRDTKDKSKVPHYFTAPEWAAFVLGVKAGEFD
ncbi:DUF397 domain-containing protein [Amycolatopsis sp. H20-H5]|uniref:DUF397 domain-containing protein n=1 Tax=Amycolatopsis sp. H20-H5 TaxID=3046309 RepID=UPI002DBBE870|nr:DUF397 domain-containing protein [Amycolatopsis sp. H20-H5]MEC3982318.1 DUF397 domain-containing protein [Amycolatopsis sp. H20-H5]